MSKHVCLAFVGEKPDVSQMPSFVSTVGFRPLSEASPETLPAGSMVVLYDLTTDNTKTVICQKFEKDNGFFYMHKLGPYFDSWRYSMLVGDNNLKNYLYKVIS